MNFRSLVLTGTAGVSGGGVGVLNNPVGPEIHFRIGGYPLVARGQNGFTRKGLMLGVDARIFFLSQGGVDLTVGQVLASIGYEVF